MTECNQSPFPFEAHFSLRVVAQFVGVQTTTDGGALLLLREADRKIGLLKRVTQCFTDERDPERVEYGLSEMLAQPICGLALGHEDLRIIRSHIPISPFLRPYPVLVQARSGGTYRISDSGH